MQRLSIPWPDITEAGADLKAGAVPLNGADPYSFYDIEPDLQKGDTVTVEIKADITRETTLGFGDGFLYVSIHKV